MKIKNKTALIILDGWGIGPAWGGNAIVSAKKLNFDYWLRTFPSTSMLAAGEAVGLPIGTGGNSETGHLNIGAGRVVLQDLPFIDSKIKDGSFFKNQEILSAFSHVKKNKSKLHLIGLVGFGKVHSDINHLFVLLKMAKDNGLSEVYLDLFTDGRDSPPTSAQSVFEMINQKIKEIGIGKISSISGRFFAMDRNKNWGRTSRTYNALTKGESDVSPTVRDVISKAYVRSINDEYIEPHLIANKGEERTLIKDGDAIILFNYRPDRARQLSLAFSPESISELPDRKILKNLYFVTFVARDPEVIGIQPFIPPVIKNTLAEVVSDMKLSQFHIAETEKYAHVTYFINGGREKPFPGENQFMVPSPKVPTYDLAPAMSADKISDKVISLATKNIDLLIINYANADMVGHSGNYQATVQAIEVVDKNLGRVVGMLSKVNYTIFIVGDHGNAEEMLNPRSNQSQTEHTENPVPFMIITKDILTAKQKLISGSALCDVAPTILAIMGIEKPSEMTGKNLLGGK